MKKDVFATLKKLLSEEEKNQLFQKEMFEAQEDFREKKYEEYLAQIRQSKIKTAQNRK